MAQKPKGGRGCKAPYESRTVRVPLPVMDKVEAVVDEFIARVIANDSQNDNPSEDLSKNSTVTYEESVENAKLVLKSKESAFKSLTRLLHLNHGRSKTDVEKDLKNT